MSLQISCTSTSLSAAFCWMSFTRLNSSDICVVASERSCLQAHKYPRLSTNSQGQPKPLEDCASRCASAAKA